MSNLTIYHSNRLKEASAVSGTEQTSSSSPQYLFDDRLSFVYTATGTQTMIQVDAASTATGVSHLILSDHSLSGGSGIVDVFIDAERTMTAGVAFSGTLGFGDPLLTPLDMPSSGTYINLALTTSGGQQLQIGELFLVEEFTSPQRPETGSITTTYTPHRTIFELKNSERQSLRHGGVTRTKTYTIPLMTLEDAQTWIELYGDGEGVELVILSDEVDAVYPVYLNKQLATTTNGSRININLELTEVKL